MEGVFRDWKSMLERFRIHLRIIMGVSWCCNNNVVLAPDMHNAIEGSVSEI